MEDVQSVGERYGLLRDNFILDPLSDTECFAREDIRTQAIADGLDIDLVTGMAPKRLVWGPYGGGKTHTLMRTMRQLDGLTDVHVVRMECPDLSKKSRFHDLYREGIMREIGQDFVLGLIEEAVQRVGLARREEMLDRIKRALGSEELAKAAIRIIDPNFEELRLWRWIAGVPLSRSDLDDLGQTQDLTQAEAARLADMIITLGRLLKELRGQTLVLVLDEMERLYAIGPETVTTFLSGFARLADPNQKYVSVLIGSSADAEDELVEIFRFQGPVSSRLGDHAKIEIPSLHDEDVGGFIRGVVEYLRDDSADLAGLVDAARKETDETVGEAYFPLTEEAVDALKSQLSHIMTPREITIKMTRALGRAYRQRCRAVEAAHVIS